MTNFNFDGLLFDLDGRTSERTLTATTQMLVKWRRNMTRSTEIRLRSPSEVSTAVDVHRTNHILPWASMRRFAQMIGLKPLPLMSPSQELLKSWLQMYGPIWTDGVPIDAAGNPAGTGHVVVISGFRERNGNSEIRIHDPWPPNVGNISWRPFSHLSGILSDGANPNRDTFFLRIGI